MNSPMFEYSKTKEPNVVENKSSISKRDKFRLYLSYRNKSHHKWTEFQVFFESKEDGDYMGKILRDVLELRGLPKQKKDIKWNFCMHYPKEQLSQLRMTLNEEKLIKSIQSTPTSLPKEALTLSKTSVSTPRTSNRNKPIIHSPPVLISLLSELELEVSTAKIDSALSVSSITQTEHESCHDDNTIQSLTYLNLETMSVLEIVESIEKESELYQVPLIDDVNNLVLIESIPSHVDCSCEDGGEYYDCSLSLCSDLTDIIEDNFEPGSIEISDKFGIFVNLKIVANQEEHCRSNLWWILNREMYAHNVAVAENILRKIQVNSLFSSFSKKLYNNYLNSQRKDFLVDMVDYIDPVTKEPYYSFKTDLMTGIFHEKQIKSCLIQYQTYLTEPEGNGKYMSEGVAGFKKARFNW